MARSLRDWAASQQVTWLAFLRKIDKEVAPELELHVIGDNYSTHKHAKVIAWLKRHPRFHLHFIPAFSRWLNLVERFFGEITTKVIRPGSFRSVAALVADIFRFLDHHNLNAKPYRWTADPKRILGKKSSGPGRRCSKRYTILFLGPHTRIWHDIRKHRITC
jgi:putative transposase